MRVFSHESSSSRCNLEVVFIWHDDARVRQTGRIFVRTLTGKTIDCDVLMNITLKEMYLKIQEKEGIPPDHQRLIFKGAQCSGGKRLTNFGVRNESTMHLVLRQRGGGWKVTVNYGDEEITFDCGNYETIKHLKRLIEKELEIPVAEQTLSYMNRILPDSEYPYYNQPSFHLLFSSSSLHYFPYIT
ncbi:ubiquitin-like protein [Thozetella sp. PMI_491]|nr:ubiquitin-like protein [Thozetella sp. PMI_491]